MNTILELENVSKKYKKSDFSLKNISFSLEKGNILGFVGENGAGKSTTIDCILNVLKKDSGIIRLFGQEMSNSDIKLREKISVVYDSDNFPEYLNAKQLSNIFKDIYKNWDEKIYKSYLNRFNLSEHQVIKTYSRGMSMKLAIAVALSHKAELLLLDEATSGLDPIMRDEILDVLLDFVKDENHSILLSSHITGDLEKIADYIIFIHDGKIILNTTKDELIYDYGIMRCTDKNFEKISKEDMLSFRRKDYQIDVLVNDRNKMIKKYEEVTVDIPSIEEIMLILVKGEKNERVD